MPSLLHSYRAPSALAGEKTAPVLALSSSSGNEDGPFFQGKILTPLTAAKALSCLSRVVGEQWFDARAIADSRRRMADPIVTSGDGLVRFEGFSGCRSLYARVDLLPDSLEVVHQSTGTTNVDFNAPLRTALAKVRETDCLSMAVDENAFLLVHGQEALLERKVDLPLSWLKGLASIPTIESQCEIVAELSGTDLLDFFRNLPRTGNGRDKHWLHPLGRRFKIARTPSSNSIPLTGAKRLLCLQELIPHTTKLTVATNPSGDMTLWTVHFPGLRLTLALSPEVWRGFSGEGAALDDLSRRADPDLEEALFHRFETSVDCADAAIEFGVTIPEIRTALAALASQGRFGFDHLDARWYRRVLPGNQHLLRRTNPRIAKAESWVSLGAVSIESHQNDHARGRVMTENGTEHHVETGPGIGRCTCFWLARFGLSRGPCSHLIALRLAIRPSS